MVLKRLNRAHERMALGGALPHLKQDVEDTLSLLEDLERSRARMFPKVSKRISHHFFTSRQGTAPAAVTPSAASAAQFPTGLPTARQPQPAARTSMPVRASSRQVDLNSSSFHADPVSTHPSLTSPSALSTGEKWLRSGEEEHSLSGPYKIFESNPYQQVSKAHISASFSARC